MSTQINTLEDATVAYSALLKLTGDKFVTEGPIKLLDFVLRERRWREEDEFYDNSEELTELVYSLVPSAPREEEEMNVFWDKMLKIVFA